MRLLVLGIGSPFGDDKLGWYAIDGLKGLPQQLSDHDVVLDKVDRPGVILLERMKGFDAVVLVDALLGDEPGRLHCLGPEDIAQSQCLLSGHGLGVADALALGKALGGLPERLLLLGIEVGDQPNLALEPAQIESVLGRIASLICDWVADPRCALPRAPDIPPEP